MANWKKLALFGSSALLLAACGNGDTTDDADTTDTGDSTEETADTDSETSDFSIAMVTDTGGVDDRSFNQSSWEGMQDWAEENGMGDDAINYYQSEAEDQYIQNLNSAKIGRAHV